MPFICIGPVCIPWTAVVPLVLWLGRPIWVRLPLTYQQAIKSRWDAMQAYLQPMYDRLGWKAKAKKSADAGSESVSGSAGDAQASLLASRGGVVGLHTDADWEAALAATRATPELALFVDFTAVWCGPCQRIAPDYAKLAAAHPGSLFVKVDVDELEDVSQECGVSMMPTFQLYKGGSLADSLTGANVAKLEAFVVKHASK